MLTTDALNISSLSWFEAGFRQQTPVGLPPSLSELIAQAQLSSLTASLFFCLYGTLSQVQTSCGAVANNLGMA